MDYLPFYVKDLYDKNSQGQRFLSLLISTMVVVGLYLISLVNYLLFHTLLEIICVVIVAGIFILTWNVRNYLTNNYLKIIGFCYGFIAVINLFHALTYGGINILSGYGANQSIQFWMAEAYLLSITILIASFLIGDRRLDDYSVIGCLTIVTFTFLIAVFLGGFPDCFIKGKGLTPFKVFSEYAITVVLIASLFPLYRKRAQFDRRVFALIFSSVFFTIISEIFFSGYTTLFDSANLVGHLLKVSAYCFIFQAILVTGLRKPFNIIFRDLKQAEDHLQRANETLEQKVIERTTELAQANRGLLDEITERKQAEKALRESEKKYRTLIQKIQAAVVVHGSDKGILTCNSKAQEILGLTEEQLLGKTAVDPDWHFFREDNTIMPLEEYPVNLVFSSRNGIRNYIVGVHRPNSNDDVWALVNADPVWDKENELIQVIVTFVDITERKHAEEEIARNLAINQALSSLYIPLVTTGISIEKIANIVLKKSRQLTGSHHGFVAEIDPVTGDLIAHTNTTMLQTECKIAEDEQRKIRFPRRTDGLYNGLWGHSMNTREPFYTDVPENHPASVGIPEGHIAIERFLAVPVLPAGELVGLIALSNSNRAYTDRDLEAISRIADFYALAIQHKRTEEEIRQLNQELEQRVIERTAKLNAVNKELEAFAYSVSHDLRAPLRHIGGYLELLEKRIASGLDGQSRHYMTAITDSANRMGVLIDELLSFSRMGRNALSFQPVDLGELVHDVIRELEPDTGDRNIEWRIEDLPAVGGDTSMLRIVLVNLIANALKFTRSRQQVRIEIGSLPGRDSETVVYVSDNGVGFDMTYADKLFGVFQRLHRADEFEGTGIGLANVRRIIARHGGRTWAEGKVNEGATFYFSLPQISERK